MDAKDDVVKAGTGAEIADALLSVERRITISAYWIVGVVVVTVVGCFGVFTAIVLSAIQAMSRT